MRQRNLPTYFSKRNRSLGIIGMSGLFMLFMHQNCAPAGSAMSSGTSTQAEAALPVSTIDDMKSSLGLSFNTKEVEVSQQTNTVALQGACSKDQDGARLGWHVTVQNDDGSPGEDFASGFSDCENGVFQVKLAPTQELICGKKYKVSARLGLGQPGESILSRHCNL